MKGNHPIVGISDIAVYLPRLRIDHQAIIRGRIETGSSEGANSLELKFKRTLEKTGIHSMHFPNFWEDSVTMAAEAANTLIRQSKICIDTLRYLVTGTETGVDHSKPMASYVCGMLKKAGHAIPQSISTFQTQHACAGGTLALLGVSALLSVCGPSDENGIVICSDIARYEPATSAEMTQGAGAIAILSETNPKLIALDLKTAGYSSKDVDDFFRPLGSCIAKVKGSYSIRCYREAVESALLDHAKRSGQTPVDVLNKCDMIALHVPYPSLPLETMLYLLKKYLSLEGTDAEAYLIERGFYSMIEPASKSGNIYSGSMYLSLAGLLEKQYQLWGNQIVGKNILLGSYGSGNTMVFMSGTIAEKAPEVIKNWNLETLWNHAPTSFSTYERWVSRKQIDPQDYQIELAASLPEIEPRSFYLNAIREDGYREYLCKE